ncbi:large terminase [Epidermidibacterium keratini]|uniref:Large terminase n=1 Tax=Epidermidibacterium keratini TaxID=1891644 RepID=A0A7L4YKV5_9ACTN|nr:large terminase [Epidermidibacterium keratini]
MLLVVPGQDERPWPTIGPQVCDFLEECAVYGPGSFQGRPYVIDAEFRAFIYRAFEVYPKGHPFAGRRRFKRVGLSVRKGLAKTEKQALLVFAHIHPDGPGRCDGFDAAGNPVAVPVKAPYVPMLAFSLDQVEELAYGALTYIIENGPEADLFDVSLERALRLDDRGKADGGAWPLAQSPDSRDGARTTLNAFDEPHRLYMPRHVQAHATMSANLPKRPLDDPWSLYVGTAGEPGQGSVAETLHTEAQMIGEGKIERPDLFYLYRTDSGSYDMAVKSERIEAIKEATGPAGEWGPGQFDDIASQWDVPEADKAYLERVWLNRWRKSSSQAFDIQRWRANTAEPIPDGSFVTVGFDGARFRDSTGIVLTDIESGVQRLYATWERPLDVDDWEIDEAEVTAVVDEIMGRFKVWRGYADPPHWTETVGSWAGRWPDQWVEWWTHRTRQMAFAVRSFAEANRAGTLLHEVGRDLELEKSFDAHVAAAGRDDTRLHDDDGQRLFVLKKIHPDRKFDNCMAAILSWQARLDAIAAGAKPQSDRASTVFGRFY